MGGAGDEQQVGKNRGVVIMNIKRSEMAGSFLFFKDVIIDGAGSFGYH